jgi:L-lactate dehydrogenase complex protein LldF
VSGVADRSGPTFLGLPTAPRGVGHLRQREPFPTAARRALQDSQLRRNLATATSTIRAKRAAVTAELPDWEALREAGQAIKAETMANLGTYLEQLEEQVTARGGHVHWATDAVAANRIVTDLVGGTGATNVVKVKSIVTDEIGLNDALASAGIRAHETDLAELIVQLGHDRPSHILVPAIHRNRAEIREIFLREMPGADPRLTDDPPALAAAARSYLRKRFLSARVAISGVNFAVAQTGTLAVVESEGNGRMCLTLPSTLISVMGIEKVIPRWQDLAVFLQLLPRSSTGERMNPYTSMWTGVTPGDGPQEFHLVLLDNGRTAALSDPQGRQALHCIRCSACMNVCPVYERVGGHAYGSVYPGPIGAVLSPLLTGIEDNATLPYASSLCGACYQVCPVKIDIPSLLVHLRAAHVDAVERACPLPGPEALTMAAASWIMSRPGPFAAAQRVGHAGRALGAGGRIRWLPPPFARWTSARDAPVPPAESFRQWWARTRGSQLGGATAIARAPLAHADGVPAADNEATPRSQPAPRPDGPPGDAARTEVRRRISRALGVEGGTRISAPDGPVPGDYRRTAGYPSSHLLDLLTERLTDYSSTVWRCRPDQVREAITAALATRGARRIAVPPDLALAGVDLFTAGPAGVDIIVDRGLSPAELDALDGVITSVALAVAETGTIVLDGRAGQGRRALTQIPDNHMCVVLAEQVVGLVPEAVAALDPVRPLTWISGPSATSDIELSRVEGVHGPRTLEVILVSDGEGNPPTYP